MGLSDMPAEAMNKPRLFRGREGKIKRLKAGSHHWQAKGNLAGYNTKSDIYSVGILACELANGQAPFIDMPITQMLLEKINGTKPMLADSTTVGQFIIDDNSVDEEGEDGRKRTPEEKAQNIFFQRTFTPPSQHGLTVSGEGYFPQLTQLGPTATQLLQQPCLKSLRRKTAEVLPELLQPVTPLTDFNKLPKDTGTVEEISQHLSEVSMIEDWSF
ncbi:hypothetical protein C0Q70_04392 [Pomacea canaliculata]|uniref:Protein kinase domain-containing protein n=1 Tax=Pomacea canaliculata TaxID=400727 RepID=A0A2T7PVE8_POMCA|nr:hypothetical protein C0Q70_04392 [Pomacea canaliculata]